MRLLSLALSWRWQLKHFSKSTEYLYQSVDSYKNSIINVSVKTDLLKSVKETEYDRIKEDLKKMEPRMKLSDRNYCKNGSQSWGIGLPRMKVSSLLTNHIPFY